MTRPQQEAYFETAIRHQLVIHRRMVNKLISTCLVVGGIMGWCIAACIWIAFASQNSSH